MWAADFDDVLNVPQSRSTSRASIASESSGVIFDNEDDNDPNEKTKGEEAQDSAELQEAYHHYQVCLYPLSL